MARFRRQISIARLVGAVLTAAVVFALPLPWQAVWPLAIGVQIPIFVIGLTTAESCVIAVILVILTGLLEPAFPRRGHHPRQAGNVVGTPTTPGPATAPPSTPVVKGARIP